MVEGGKPYINLATKWNTGNTFIKILVLVFKGLPQPKHSSFLMFIHNTQKIQQYHIM